MTQKPQAILSLICLVSFIYVLRDHKTSPVGFLQRQTSRLLDYSSPDSFSSVLCEGVNQNDPITTTERNHANSIKTSISDLRGGNPLVTFLNSTLPSTDFAKQYAPPLVKTAIIPWAAFFVISLLFCIGFVTNWCCMYCCKCGCTCCKSPKTTRFQRAYKIGSAVFMVLTFGIGIAGIVVSAKFPSAGKQVMCSAAIMLDKLIDGSQSDRWVGALPAVDKMIVVLDNLESISNSLPLALLASSATDTPYSDTLTQINTLKSDYDQKTVARGDLSVAATYIPTYTANMASTDASTGGAGAIQAELDSKNQAINASLTGAPARYTAGAGTLKTPVFILGALGVFQSVHDTAVNVSQNVTKAKNNFVANGGKGRTAMNAIGGGFIGVFAIEALIAILAVVSLFLLSRGGSRFNKVLHCNWCTLGFIVILGWILAAVLFPLSIVMFEVCEVVQDILVDPVFFNKTMDKVFNDTKKANDDPSKNDTRDYAYRCFYGDGDLLANYRTGLIPFQYIGNALDQLAPVDASAPGQIINSVQLNRQIPLVNNYKSGLIADGPEATADLAKLNSYTMNDGCSQMKDQWIFASASCGSGDGTVFPSGAAADYNVLSQTCIGFDVWSTSTSAIQTRYTTARFSGCPQVNSQAPEVYRQNFVNNFETSRTQVNQLFTNIANQLGVIKSNNDNFMTAALAYTSDNHVGSQIRQPYDPLYQALNNQTVGIMPNAYCTFIKASVEDLEEKLCYRFAPVIFEVAIVMIIASFIALFGFIILFCSAKRNNVYEERQHAKDRRGIYKSASGTDY